MKFLDILAQIRSTLSRGVGADLSFGTATQVNDLTVIPVARISMAVGGGGGSSPVTGKKAKSTPDAENLEAATEQPQSNEPVNGGGGGGGQVKTTPVGIYVIKDDKVKFYPLIGVRDVLMAMGMVMLLLFRIRKITRKKRK